MKPILLSLLFVASGSVQAHPGPGLPEVSVGENPRRSFGGSVVGGSMESVFTVPAGQEFIVTMVGTSTAGVSPARDVIHGLDFLENSDVVLSGYILSQTKKASIVRGDGRLRIREGSTLYARREGAGGTRAGRSTSSYSSSRTQDRGRLTHVVDGSGLVHSDMFACQ